MGMVARRRILASAPCSFSSRAFEPTRPLPQQHFLTLSQISYVTAFSLLLMSAAGRRIVEQASFRGYMQGPIKRRPRPGGRDPGDGKPVWSRSFHAPRVR